MSLAASSPSVNQAPSREAVMAQAGSENFPVASYLLGRPQRAHLMAIYGFARLVDDLGDEAPGDRLAHLDWLASELDRLYAGAPVQHPVMQSLGATVSDCRLPDGPFRRLIEANRRDQTEAPYATFADLLGYCQLSAAPVGELVLHVFGAASAERIALSDRICAALQVTEHLQDVLEDYHRGRLYLPQEDMAQFGCSDSDLERSELGDAWPQLIAHEAERARSLLTAGAPLTRTLSPRPRAAVASFIAGGRAALDALARGGYDVRAGPWSLGKWSFAAGWMRAVRGR